ncbi:unnamed protein product [Caenorhabditis sp. 36 PRJEB53466]|nr:unnamed protein product [Caenorhabditis sp. 36 PRJEB53466]
MITLYTLLFSITVSVVFCATGDFTVDTYPNPRRGGFKECGLRSAGSVCDPYETLSESERYRINTALVSFRTKTELSGNDFCTRKGTDAMFVIVNQASQQFTDDLRKHWNDIDTQCGRFGLLLLSFEDRRIYGSFDERSPIKMSQLQAIIATEDAHIQTGSFTTAVTNILKEVAASMTPLSGSTTQPPTTTMSASTQFTIASVFLTFLLSYLL